MARNLGVLIHNAFTSMNKPRSENARHAKRAWKRRGPSFSFSKFVLWLTIIFLFLPLFVIIVYSFNQSKGAEFTKVSLTWYKELFFNSKALWQALLNSILVAFTSAAVSTVLGTMASIGVNWYKFRGKKFIQQNGFRMSIREIFRWIG